MQTHFSQYPSIISPQEIKEQVEKIDSIAKFTDSLRIMRRTKQFEDHGIPKQKLYRVEHHMAHAASAYYGWGKFDEPVLVLTCDGSGDRLSATVNIGKDGKITRIAYVRAEYSIGLIYAMTTLLLGMKPNEHEYKLMGMAPYAHKEDGEKLARKFAAYFENDPGNHLGWRTANGMKNTYRSYNRLRNDFEFERFDAICAGLQLWTENFLTDWVKRCIYDTGIRKVALSGGVFMNVKANKCIMELDDVDDLFVFPSCGDETNPIGASLLYYAEKNGISGLEPLGPIYWGIDYSYLEIESCIKQNDGFTIEQPTDLSKRIAELLSKGEIVARFKGRDEFGARALGNRSILADPSRTDIIRVINDMIKNRDFWMPFACSIKAERIDDYLVNPKKIKAPYMVMTFDTTDWRKEIVAGTHPYDGTCRSQVVYREHNPDYYQIITEFEKITGIGAVLNTSFNIHGYPIVHSPDDAIYVIKNSGLKYLAIGSYLLIKD